MLIEKYHQTNLKKKKEKEITAYSGFRKKKKKTFPYILCIWVKDKCAFHTKNYFFTNTSAV